MSLIALFSVHIFPVSGAVCRRVGGAFGGKVSRSMPIAAAAAVAANATGRRVRFQLDRNADMRGNGGMSF